MMRWTVHPPTSTSKSPQPTPFSNRHAVRERGADRSDIRKRIHSSVRSKPLKSKPLSQQATRYVISLTCSKPREEMRLPCCWRNAMRAESSCPRFSDAVKKPLKGFKSIASSGVHSSSSVICTPFFVGQGRGHLASRACPILPRGSSLFAFPPARSMRL